MGRQNFALALIILFLLIGWRGEVWLNYLRLNREAQYSLHSLMNHSNQRFDSLSTEQTLETVVTCRLNWLRGRLAHAANQKTKRDMAWFSALRCWEGYIPMLRPLVPEHLELAKLAVVKHHKHAEGWFWLAQIHAREAPEEAIIAYRQAIRLRPDDWYYSYALGEALRFSSPQTALEPLQHVCYHGIGVIVPAGCVVAGRLAEELQDIEAAIEYYRRSEIPIELERANRLEPLLP